MGPLPTPSPRRFSSQEKGVLVAGALAAAGIVTWGVLRARALRRDGERDFPPVDCSMVGTRDGELAGFRYLERVTPGADPEQPLPMVVLFHSRGSRPENHAGMLYKSLGFPVRVLLPEGPNPLGSRRSWTSRASRTNDQEAWADELEDLGEDMAQFIHEAVACRPTVGQPVVTGSSEGGHVAYLMASLYPDMVAGAVAVAGYLPEQLWDPSMARTVGLHGTEDTAVPYPRTEQYWKAMEAEGAPLTYRSFPGVGHGVTSSVSKVWHDALRSMVV